MIESFFGFSAGGSQQPGITVYPVMDLGEKQKPASQGVAGYMPADAKLFSGKLGQTLPVTANGKTVLLLGMGAPKTISESTCAEAGAALQQALQKFTGKDVIVQPVKKHAGLSLSAETVAAHMANGAVLKGYSFGKYKTPAKKDDNDSNTATNLYFTGLDAKKAEALYAPLKAVADGVYLARDLANEPPNIAYPLYVARVVGDTFAGHPDVGVSVFSTRELLDLKAGGILAVGQGSKQPPCMVVIEYDGTGGRVKRPDLALVGKGVTFDTGGISIKPSANMQDMKYDMSGAADVIGTMLALSRRKANTRVVGIVGLAENMPDGNAYRPGDVIRLMSGKTVEITNTDAEGRLVLSDCLTYVEREYKPKAIIDLATLTGACVAALGRTYAAVLTRDEKLEKRIISAGRAVGELCHPMPLHEVFTKAVKGSRIADLNNSVPGPGTSTAGAFLEQAVLNKTPWAHMDIAGMAYGVSEGLYPGDGTASGFGVRLLDRLIADHYEHAQSPQAKPDRKPSRKP